MINNLNHITPLKQNFKASLLTMMQQPQTAQAKAVQIETQGQMLPSSNPAFMPVSTPIADKYTKQSAGSSLLNSMMNKIAAKSTTSTVPRINTKKSAASMR